jgi:hypothetical protein
MVQRSDRLLKVILTLTSFTMIIVWLPLIRGWMDGNSYAWGHSLFGKQFAGKGISGDYWLVVLQAVIGIALVYLGWRGAKQPFHWLLLLWNVSGFLNAFYNAIQFPEEYRFRGDTLGVDVSVAWVGPLFWSVLTVLSILWVVRDLKTGVAKETPKWDRSNWVLLSVAAAMLPLQFILLRFGQPHGTTDQIGVILTMLQWVVLNLSFVPWASRKLSDHAPA